MAAAGSLWPAHVRRGSPSGEMPPAPDGIAGYPEQSQDGADHHAGSRYSWWIVMIADLGCTFTFGIRDQVILVTCLSGHHADIRPG